MSNFKSITVNKQTMQVCVHACICVLCWPPYVESLLCIRVHACVRAHPSRYT